MRRILAALAVATALGSFAAPLFAAEPSDADVAEAKELFKAAVKLFKEGQHAQALEKFQKSFELRPHWRLHLNIGLCYKELSMYTEAKEEFDLFIKEGADSLDEASLDQVNAELEDLESTIAVLKIDIMNPGATIKLDGKEVGKSPLLEPVEVNPGAHVLEAVLDGHRSYREEFLLSKGQKKEFTVTLEALPEDEVTPPIEPPPGEEKKTRSKAAPAFWVMGGLTLAAAGGATAMGVLTLQRKQELDDLDSSTEDSYPDAYTPQDHEIYIKKRNSIKDEGKLFGILTTSLMAAAGAALVGTIVAGILTHPFAPKEEQPTEEEAPPPETATPGIAVAPVPLPGGGAMVSVAGYF